MKIGPVRSGPDSHNTRLINERHAYMYILYQLHRLKCITLFRRKCSATNVMLQSLLKYVIAKLVACLLKCATTYVVARLLYVRKCVCTIFLIATSNIMDYSFVAETLCMRANCGFKFDISIRICSIPFDSVMLPSWVHKTYLFYV